MKSRGYRKVPGDICTGGDIDFEPYQFTCCDASVVAGSSSKPAITGLSVALSLAILVALVMAVLAAISAWYVLLGVMIHVNIYVHRTSSYTHVL